MATPGWRGDDGTRGGGFGGGGFGGDAFGSGGFGRGGARSSSTYDRSGKLDKFGVARLFQGDIKPRQPAQGALGTGGYWVPRNDPIPTGVSAPDRAAYIGQAHIGGGARVRFSMRRGFYYGILSGAAVASLLLFFAGFLAAYLLFTDAGYPVASAPGPAPVTEPASEGLARPAQAVTVDDTLPPPAPEILAAQRARDAALAGTTNAAGESGDTAWQTETDADSPGTATGQHAVGGLTAVSDTLDVQAQEAAASPSGGTAPSTLWPRPRLKPALPEHGSGVVEDFQESTQAARVLPGNDRTSRARDEDNPQLGSLGTSIIASGAPYSLQFGAFSQLGNAERLRARLASAVADIRIEIGSGADGAALHYVRSGGYESRLAADRAVAKLRREYGIVGIVHVNLLEG